MHGPPPSTADFVVGISDGQVLKRKSSTRSGIDENDTLEITPLGSGQEVGRSCLICKFKEKTVMFDCGIHPGKHFEGSLPFFDECDLEGVDVCLITHFHIDHVGALPYLTEQTTFEGRVFMTHPTKAISPMVLTDFVRQSTTKDRMLYDETDVDRCFSNVELLQYHEEKEVNGIKFWAYNAGHVLGAAMFMIEIDGVRVLYTGDFSRWDDRHLTGAETPPISPDILLCESTFGAQEHPSAELREKKLMEVITQTLKRNGRVLLPVFALGRAQEILLILDEYWEKHPELQSIPIYYGSRIASKSMLVYKKYLTQMNANIQRQMDGRNPFDFKHVEMLKSVRDFDDHGPSIVMCSPGTIMSGMSRELFDLWCDDSKNSVIIPGYMVKGTFAEEIGSGASKEIRTLSGETKPCRIQSHVISFSAHSDYAQSSDLITSINPPNIVLMHGEATMMAALKKKLISDKGIADERIRMPANCETIQFQFHGQKMVKIVGQLAEDEAVPGKRVTGLLVRKNFDLHMVDPDDVHAYSTLKTSKVTHRQILQLKYSGSFARLQSELQKAYENCDELPKDYGEGVKVMGVVTIELITKDGAPRVALEWEANPVADTIADHVVAVVADIESNPGAPDALDQTTDDEHEEAVLRVVLEMLKEQFGSVEIDDAKEMITIKVDGEVAQVNHETKEIICESAQLKENITYSLRRIEYALYPMPDLFEGDEYEAEDSSPILDSAAADEPAAELPADVVA